MNAEGKRIWAALCKAGATEEDRAEAADQRAQADEEKAEAERNIAEADQLKEGASIRAALGFPKDALWPSEAATVVNNAVIQHQNAQTMSEEDEDEPSDKKAGRGGGYGPDGGWYEDDRDYDYDDEPTPTCQEQDDWDDLAPQAVRTGKGYGKRFVKMVKSMGWKITGEDYAQLGDDLEEGGRGDWVFEFGVFTVNGKGGQKMRLPRGKSIVLDRNVSEDITLWARFESEDASYEVDSGKTTGDGWNEPREPIMYTLDLECPEADKLAGIGLAYDIYEPDRWFKPNQLDKMLEYFALTFPREFKIRSKVKKRGEDMLSKEGQTIRDELGFPKTGGDDEDEAIRNIIYYLAEKAELPAVDFMEPGNDEWRVAFDWKDSWDFAKDEWEALAEDAGKGVPSNWKNKQQREFDELLEDALGLFQRYKIDGGIHRGDMLLLETESLAAFANNPRSRSMRACVGLTHSKEAGRLNLGRVVQTRGVSSKARENRAFGKEVQDAFRKYQRGDWGDTERDSVKRNNAVVKDGVEDQVFAVYDTSEGKMYIITEWDGSVTTILFSHEY
jgi:hypothetical protein